MTGYTSLTHLNSITAACEDLTQYFHPIGVSAESVENAERRAAFQEQRYSRPRTRLPVRSTTGSIVTIAFRMREGIDGGFDRLARLLFERRFKDIDNKKPSGLADSNFRIEHFGPITAVSFHSALPASAVRAKFSPKFPKSKKEMGIANAVFEGYPLHPLLETAAKQIMAVRYEEPEILGLGSGNAENEVTLARRVRGLPTLVDQSLAAVLGFYKKADSDRPFGNYHLADAASFLKDLPPQRRYHGIVVSRINSNMPNLSAYEELLKAAVKHLIPGGVLVTTDYVDSIDPHPGSIPPMATLDAIHARLGLEKIDELVTPPDVNMRSYGSRSSDPVKVVHRVLMLPAVSHATSSRSMSSGSSRQRHRHHQA